MVINWIFVLVLGLNYVDSIPMRIVDLTHIFNNDTVHYPTQREFDIHLVKNGTFNTKYWLQYEEYNTAIHVGTHIDAPAHVIKGAWTVDKIPWERLIAPAAVVDVEKKAENDPDYLVTIADLTNWELITRQYLSRVILLIRTGYTKKYDNKELYFGTTSNDTSKFRFPGLSLEAAEWLVKNREIYGYGIETLSLDNGSGEELPVHTTLLGGNVYGLEMLANVDQLPSHGAMLYVMPMNIENGSGAPTRVVAIIP